MFQKFDSHDIELSGLEFDVVNLMSDLLSHWLSVPRSYCNPLGFSFFSFYVVTLHLQCAGKFLWSLEQWCPAEWRRGKLRQIHASYKIPFVQIAKLVASRNHMAGFDLSHELFRAAYDIAFYSGFYPQFTFHFWIDVLLHNMVPPEDPENENYQALATRLWPQYLVDNLLIAIRSCISILNAT